MPEATPSTGLIEVKIQELNQLFNSMDPSPFHERDLDHDAEEFIVSWAQEHPKQHDLRLVVHLASEPAGVRQPQKLVTDCVAHYFTYRAEMVLREFKRLMREGRAALLVGLVFLAICQISASLVSTGTSWGSVTREGLTIMGWVAMWRPLEIYLYRWWPLLSMHRLYQRLADMPVEVRLPPR
jgi:hypothetical protein